MPLAGLALGGAAAVAMLFGLSRPRSRTVAAPAWFVPAAGRAPARDFSGEVRLARTIEVRSAREEAFGAALQRWLAADFPAAAAYVRALPPGPEAAEALMTVLEFQLQRAPWQALALAKEWAVTPETAAIFSEIFASLGRIDPPAAARAWTTLESPRARSNGLRALLSVWARRDLDAALTWAHSPALAASRDGQEALSAVLETLAATDPARAGRLALQSLTGDAQAQVLGAAARQIGIASPETAAELIGSLPAGPEQRALAAESAGRWALHAPAHALQWSLQLPEPARSAATVATLRAWAVASPSEAAAAITVLPSPALKAASSDAVAEVLGAAQSAAAADPSRATVMPAALRSPSSVGVFASAWAAREPAAAALWAATLPEGATKTAALQGALSYVAMDDPQGARDFVAALDPQEQSAAADEVAGLSAQRDPAAAVTWAETLAAGPARTAALTSAADTWATYVPAAAALWATALPLGPDRDRALAAVALRYAARSPSEAAALAGTIVDPQIRLATLAALPPTY